MLVKKFNFFILISMLINDFQAYPMEQTAAQVSAAEKCTYLCTVLNALYWQNELFSYLKQKISASKVLGEAIEEQGKYTFACTKDKSGVIQGHRIFIIEDMSLKDIDKKHSNVFPINSDTAIEQWHGQGYEIVSQNGYKYKTTEALIFAIKTKNLIVKTISRDGLRIIREFENHPEPEIRMLVEERYLVRKAYLAQEQYGKIVAPLNSVITTVINDEELSKYPHLELTRQFGKKDNSNDIKLRNENDNKLCSEYFNNHDKYQKIYTGLKKLLNTLTKDNNLRRARQIIVFGNASQEYMLGRDLPERLEAAEDLKPILTGSELLEQDLKNIKNSKHSAHKSGSKQKDRLQAFPLAQEISSIIEQPADSKGEIVEPLQEHVAKLTVNKTTPTQDLVYEDDFLIKIRKEIPGYQRHLIDFVLYKIGQQPNKKIDKIYYDNRVNDWKDSPLEALLKQGYLNKDYSEKELDDTIVHHAFPRKIDSYLKELSVPVTYLKRTQEGQEQIPSHAIPGEIRYLTSDGKDIVRKYVVLFTYAFDKNGKCYHRCATRKNAMELLEKSNWVVEEDSK